MLSPYAHRCLPTDCYYIGGEVECAYCGRVWKLVRGPRGGLRYVMDPLVKRPPPG